MSLIITVVCFAISAGMLLSLLTLLKRSKKMKKLIACIDVINDESQFEARMDEYIETIHDPEFITKGEILKLWALIKHRRPAAELETLLEKIDLRSLIIDPKRKRHNKISLNEDSFYYLCFACQFKAYSQKETELLHKLHDKIMDKEDYFQDQLFYKLYRATYDNYFHQGDWGEQSFLDIAQGMVRKLRCSRQMLDIYRNIAAAFLAKIASEKKNEELYEKIKKPVNSWSATEMGRNIMNDLGIMQHLEVLESWTKTEADTSASEIIEVTETPESAPSEKQGQDSAE